MADKGKENGKAFAEELRRIRIRNARRAIELAGGPQALANALSAFLSRSIERDRVAKWRYTGIPVKWGIIVEHLVTDVTRKELNPWEYTEDTQDIHRTGIAFFLVNSK